MLTSWIKRSAVPSKDSFVYEEDIRSFLRPSDPTTTLFPLSEVVSGLLADNHNSTNLPDSSDPALSRRLLKVLQRSDILWKSAFPHNKMVFKCGPDLVVKAIRKLKDYTEYTTLQYLEKHMPSIPAPKPLGLIRISGISLIFITYIAETYLKKMWTKLDITQKASIQNQLNEILANLRSLPYSNETPFGGVEGESCKDIRKHLRRSTKPIITISDFKDFLFSSSRPNGQVFATLLRRLSPLHQRSMCELPRCVFTHSDLRPDNITMRFTDSGQYLITGLLD